MTKRFLPLLCVIAVCFALLCPIAAQAVTPLEPDREASLTLRYEKEGVAFPDLQVCLYRVANAFPEGIFRLIPPYSGYPIHIHDISDQGQWKYIASTLCACITADQLPPDRETVTDAEGVARFTQLKTGLYLVREAMAENNTGIYYFDAFMVYLPTPQPEGYVYDVQAKPKCTAVTPKTRYSVNKLWQDGDFEGRPTQVLVDIFENGTFRETQVLNASNNWSYSWYVSGQTPGIWTVAEQSVPEGYRVAIQESGGVFSIINTRPTQPEPPKTGDSFTPLPWILAMCLSGMALLILGLYRRRHR